MAWALVQLLLGARVVDIGHINHLALFTTKAEGGLSSWEHLVKLPVLMLVLVVVTPL